MRVRKKIWCIKIEKGNSELEYILSSLKQSMVSKISRFLFDRLLYFYIHSSPTLRIFISLGCICFNKSLKLFLSIDAIANAQHKNDFPWSWIILEFNVASFLSFHQAQLRIWKIVIIVKTFLGLNFQFWILQIVEIKKWKVTDLFQMTLRVHCIQFNDSTVLE